MAPILPQPPDTDGGDGAFPARVRGFDALRGFSVCSMVAFHLCYDLKFLAGVTLAWFAPPLQDIWRASISWTFLFVAGCMCAYSRSNLYRALRYLAVALAIYALTTLAAVDVPISFGIMYCMGASTLIVAALERLGRVPSGPLATVALFCVFLLTLSVPRGAVGLGALRAALPRAWYATPWLSWLGFPGPGFASGDYYPLIPFTLMYLTGTSMGTHWRRWGAPAALTHITAPVLEWVGRHALEVYVLHQPLLLLLVAALTQGLA